MVPPHLPTPSAASDGAPPLAVAVAQLRPKIAQVVEGPCDVLRLIWVLCGFYVDLYGFIWVLWVFTWDLHGLYGFYMVLYGW